MSLHTPKFILFTSQLYLQTVHNCLIIAEVLTYLLPCLRWGIEISTLCTLLHVMLKLLLTLFPSEFSDLLSKIDANQTLSN